MHRRLLLSLAFPLFLVTLAMTGCRTTPNPDSAAASTSSASGAVSGPPEYNAYFEARKPRKCNAVTHAPNATEAAALVQCAHDDERNTNTYLVQNVKVTTMTPPRPFNYAMDAGLSEVDTNGQVFDMRGSYSIAQCDGVNDYAKNTGKNCRYTDADTAKGGCWKTSYGSWTCELGSMHLGDGRNELPGPRTYDEVH